MDPEQTDDETQTPAAVEPETPAEPVEPAEPAEPEAEVTETATEPAPTLAVHEQAPLAFVPGPDALEAAGGDGIFNADGTVNMVIIRPCHGRGMYNNIYEADMLARDAGKFASLPIFDNHESPVARKARMGIPRPVSELAGAVRESWWDPSFTGPDDAKYGYEKGAVVGKCALTDTMEALVRKIPEVVKGSLNTQATSKRPAQRNGKKGWIVEGFEADPDTSSFDLVTRAGAGGRVASVLEAAYADHDEPDPLAAVREALAADSVSDDALLAVLREHRPAVLESEGDADMGMTLKEALESDEVQGYIATLVDARVQESALDVDTIREQVREEMADASRVRRLGDEARRIIEAAKLPAGAKQRLLVEYGVSETDDESVTPGRSLGVIEAEVDDDGQVTKAASDVLKAALEADIADYRKMFAEAAPTVPRAPVTAGIGTAPAGAGNDVQESAWEQKLRARGLDPTQFGAPKREPANS